MLPNFCGGLTEHTYTGQIDSATLTHTAIVS